jgi:hypothetical protein
MTRINRSDYKKIRRHLLADECAEIVRLERKYMGKFQTLIAESYSLLKQDFDRSSDLYPFWANYPPAQRGRKPRGDSVPWIEVGQASLSENLIRLVTTSTTFHAVCFPGLPCGGDVRFATEDAFIHFDIKVTGPRDATNEVVASHYQISGDGHQIDAKGHILNSVVTIQGTRKRDGAIAGEAFQPELPPFYILDGRPLPCLTFFLKAVYRIVEPGVQPLSYAELVAVPNGLILWDGPKYNENYIGLITPGKDDRTVSERKKRRRVKLDVLVTIDEWRSVQFREIDDSHGSTVEVIPRRPPMVDSGVQKHQIREASLPYQQSLF